MSEIVELDVGRGASAFSTLRSASAETLSDDPYDGFNVCHYTGDAPEHVSGCRAKLARRLGVSVEALIIPRQTHSVNVAVIGDKIPSLEDTDALVTRRDDVVLVVNTADCLPVVFSDCDNGVIGIAHAGWRGLYDGVIENTVAAMERLGAERNKLHAAIGPCICADCYEVDEEFAERFAGKFGEEVRIAGYSGRPHVDLRVAAMKALAQSGIDSGRVEVSPLCSKCDARLFSARRMGIASGRIATVVRKKKILAKE